LNPVFAIPTTCGEAENNLEEEHRGAKIGQNYAAATTRIFNRI